MAKMSLVKEYKAPIEKVWEALTTPELIKKFWAPPNMKTVEASIDKVETGGIFQYSMKSDEGFQQIVKCEYKVVDKPNKLSFYEVLIDRDGNEVPPSYYGMPGEEIKKHLTELILEEKNGVTKLTMNIDYGDDKTNEFASYGWKGMLENLAEVVE
jgi:uncharacterized protein YndB with AHSA1/START domain